MGCGITKKDISQVVPLETIARKVISSLNLVHVNEKNFLDQYKVEKILGQGSYGEVRIALHKHTGQERAVKLFNKETDFDHSYIKVKNEIEVLRFLRHPCIIKMYEYFEDSKRLYIVTEKCNGGELFDVISQRSTISENDSAIICKQLFSAVAYLHENNITHRDIKPENILLDENEDLLNIKIIDFGAATRFSDDQPLSDLVGSPFYISPEMISASYSKECDLWSCGVVLYILLCGSPPFDGKNNVEILNKVKIGEVSFTRPIWNTVSEEAKDLVLKLLCPARERLSAVEALRHNWVQSLAAFPQLERPVIEGLKCKLQVFHRKSKLHDAITAFISSQIITTQETKELRSLFKSLDINGDGKLSKEELVSGFSVGDESQVEFISEIMAQVDLDKNGFIELDEFLMAAVNQKTLFSRENLKKAFDMMDLDGNGTISYDELKTVLGIGNDLGKPIWVDILEKTNKLSSEEINFQDFGRIVYSFFS